MPFVLGFANDGAAGRDDVARPLSVGVVGGEEEGGRLQGHVSARDDVDGLEGREGGREGGSGQTADRQRRVNSCNTKRGEDGKWRGRKG